MRIAFFVGAFPTISETWLINQVVDLRDRGIEIEVFSLKRGDTANISDRFYENNLSEDEHEY